MGKAGAAPDVAPALRLLIDMMRRRPDQKQLLIGTSLLARSTLEAMRIQGFSKEI
jgi:hypothetical protein